MAAAPPDRKRCGHLLAAGGRASVGGDLRAISCLQTACLLHLKSMQSQLKDDVALSARLQATCPAPQCSAAQLTHDTEEASSSPNFALAVQWRVCQKRILVQTLRECERCIIELRRHVLAEKLAGS